MLFPRKLSLLILAVGVTVFAFSCNGNDDDPIPPDEGQFVDSCGVNTGRMGIEVTLANDPGNWQPNTEVFVYATYEDYINDPNLPYDTYISYFVTNNEGIVDFGCYNFGNYYIFAQKQIGDELWTDLEVVQVQANRQFLLTLELRN